MNPQIQEALNTQINTELWSGYFYLAMSAHFAAAGYPGIANWNLVQFKEEQDHAMKLINFIVARNGKPELRPISEVKNSWDNPLEAFLAVQAHEQKVTEKINNLYALAQAEKDFATLAMLNWFVNEQVEEEDSVKKIIESLEMIKDNGYGLYMLDKELGQRTYSAPSSQIDTTK